MCRVYHIIYHIIITFQIVKMMRRRKKRAGFWANHQKGSHFPEMMHMHTYRNSQNYLALLPTLDAKTGLRGFWLVWQKLSRNSYGSPRTENIKLNILCCVFF